MGAMIKADESCGGMKRKVSRQSELLRSVLVHAVSAFICALVCCYSYWFPWFYCFINHFVWIYLPSVWPVVFGPKCMFVVANAIVIVVVGEWRQTSGKSRNLHDDMYDEYVRRSRGPRRVLVYKKVERKQDAAVKKIYSKAIEIKKVEMAKDIVEEEEEEIAEEISNSKEDIIKTNVNISEEVNENVAEEKQEDIKEHADEDQDTSESIDHNHASAQDDDDNEDVKIAKETRSANEGGQNGYVKKAEETRSTDDDLNKRVEDFIARVNRRRWAEAEANNWLICSA